MNISVNLDALKNDERETLLRLIGKANKPMKEEFVCQLAEEAGELTQAALKYRRTITKKNPTPKTSTEAFDNLLEELADVLLVSKILLIEETKERIYKIMNKKLGRWTSRLKKVD